jgi:hypothetical protein
MKKTSLKWLAPVLLGGTLFSATAAADSFFEVTVTNITKGSVFTPIMVATTLEGDRFFELGAPASLEIETIAETGNPGPLQDSLDAYDITNSAHLPFLGPGESVTQTVATRGKYDHISVAAMVIPTNDIFFAVNGVKGPKHGNKGKGNANKESRTVTVTAMAYDAGTELNDELCISLPGPGCGGDPGPPSDNGEGYIYPSPGIQGVGDLNANALAWSNPVAVITIRRVED